MDHNATTQTLRIQNDIILLGETKITSKDIDTMPHATPAIATLRWPRPSIIKNESFNLIGSAVTKTSKHSPG